MSSRENGIDERENLGDRQRGAVNRMMESEGD